MKIILGFVLSLMLSMSCTAEVPERIYTMQKLEFHFNNFKASKDQYQALNSLFRMNNAVLDLMEYLPEPLSNLEDDDPKVVEYRSVLNELLTEINRVKHVFNAGDFKEGKKSVKEMERIKKKGHSIFK